MDFSLATDGCQGFTDQSVGLCDSAFGSHFPSDFHQPTIQQLLATTWGIPMFLS